MDDTLPKQLELHTPAYYAHRSEVIHKLSAHLPRFSQLRFDGENRSTRAVLLAILHNIEQGNRFVRQTSLEPDVQL